MPQQLPTPPSHLRELVGHVTTEAFENDNGEPIFDGLPDNAWRSYLDFGCGCGRDARRLALQTPRPKEYVGVDLHAGMVDWCKRNLVVPGFRFEHHNVFNAGFNPDRTLPWVAQLPVPDGSVSILGAWSVFTHLVEGQTEYYLDEVTRVLAADGMLIATFFLFDKRGFPFMQDNQNALYINVNDPTNAVVYDKEYLLGAMADRGMCLVRADPPTIRGFHWVLRFARLRSGARPIDLPEDLAPFGSKPPPLIPPSAESFNGDETAQPVQSSSRAEVPTPDPLAIELFNAKTYIASLEERVADQRDELDVVKERLKASEQGRSD
jgi:SAM-dependent methyltransferase